ncbi:hypothetical protein BLOT_012411 [Blomia tropicalis]|nr:hypothetical protein BLOT_012411 [Blomia tropicalis]
MTIQWRPPKGMVIIGLIILFTYLGTFKLIGSVPINNNDTQSIHHQLAQSSNVNNHHQHHNDYQTITFETIDRWRRRRTKRSSYILGRRRTPTYYSNKYGHNTTNPHFLEPWQANPNYWIPDRYHENVVCLLAQFSGIVRVRPSNTTFRGGTFMCLQQADKNILTDRYRVYGNGVCVNLSVSFEIGSFGDRLAYECNYIWSKSLRDIHYNHNRRFYAGEVQISLKMVRIDKDPIGQAPYAFRRSRRRCAWDSVFGWQSLVILVTFLSLFIFGFLGLCVCSNLTCNGGTSPTNWCCSPFCFCCHLCSNRRRRARRNNRPTQSRALLIRNNNNRNHHHPPPPPPPSQLHLHLLQQQRQQHQQQPNGIIDRSNVVKYGESRAPSPAITPTSSLVALFDRKR